MPDLAESPARPAEVHGFSADVGKLLHLMAHSVYAERDVFLRELISNGADACEKLRLSALTEPALLDDRELAVTVTLDKDAGVLQVADTGIGMDRDDLVQNLGTIARSGTRAFLDGLAEGQSGAGLIGQFGIGFYSAFIVADTVEVASRKAGGAEAFLWSSDGQGAFSIAPIPEDRAPAHGTVVSLRLRADAQRYLEPFVVEDIVARHSAHLTVPIYLKESPSAEPRRIADGTALWARPKSELTTELYTEFYQGLTSRTDEPLLTVHVRVEGRQAFAALAFVPKTPPLDLFDVERRGRMKLYVRRVFITEEARLLPGWLRFVVGVVDSEDLPLNVSRETLQSSPAVDQIRSALTGRVLSELKKLAEGDPETYRALWEAFGSVLKEGLYEEPQRRDDLFALARFRTSKGEGWRSLAEVVADFRPNQTAIYYLAGDDLARLAASPQLEGFRARGIEVLLLPDPVDSFWVSTAVGYDGKPFRSVTQGAADIGLVPLLEDAPEPPAEAGAQVATLLAFVKQTLGDAVKDVRSSQRLATSAVCLVADDMGPDRRLGRILAAHGRIAEAPPPILEINPRHAVVEALAARLAVEGASDGLRDAAWLLLDTAAVLEGEMPKDLAGHAGRVMRLLGQGAASR